MRTTALGTGLLLIGAAFACAAARPGDTGQPRAVADLVDGDGNPVGRAVLTEEPNGVLIATEVRGLTPGRHGLHLHERGACEPPGFTSAGGHFNPGGERHGLENAEGPHAGDLPNLVVGEDGTGRSSFLNPHVTLGAGANSLLREGGTAVVVHAGPDDYRSDPAGDAGARVACGVVRAE